MVFLPSSPYNAEYWKGRVEGDMGNDNIFAPRQKHQSPSARLNFAVVKWMSGLEMLLVVRKIAMMVIIQETKLLVVCSAK